MSLSNYKGSIPLISGIKQANDGDFPLVEAHAVLVDESGTRLDTKLEELTNQSGGASASDSEVFMVHGTLSKNEVTTQETAGEIYSAIDEGKTIFLRVTNEVDAVLAGTLLLPMVRYYSSIAAFGGYDSFGENYLYVTMLVQSGGNNNTGTFTSVNLLPPDTLPNPNALTFTGAVTGIYDGSEAVEINIPEGGSGETTGAGWTSAQITMLETIFNHLVYTDTETSAIVDALIDSLKNGATEAPILNKLVVTYDNSTPVAAGTAISALNETVKAEYSNGTQTGALVEDVDYELSGTLTAGQANTITVTGKGTYAGLATVTFTVTVAATAVAVTGVALSSASISVEKGSKQAISAVISPSNATNKNITWTSSNNDIATVSGTSTTATISGVSAGDVTITATTEDGSYKATCSVTVKAASATGTHAISYDSTVDDAQTVTFSPMPEAVSDGATTTITMTANDLIESYYSGVEEHIAMNKVTASSAKMGSEKITGTDSITIGNQTDDVEISAVPTTFFPSTNQAYADGTTYAPAYSGSVNAGCSRLYELKEGKQYVYTPPASITTTYRIIFARSDKTVMGATTEQKPAAGAVTIPYSGSTSGGTASVTIPSDAKYFFIRHSSSLKTAAEQEVFANNATMLLESV